MEGLAHVAHLRDGSASVGGESLRQGAEGCQDKDWFQGARRGMEDRES